MLSVGFAVFNGLDPMKRAGEGARFTQINQACELMRTMLVRLFKRCPRSFCDRDVAQQPRFMHGALDCGPTDARQCRDFINWQIAQALPLDLKRYDAENRTLTLCIVMPQIVRHRA